MDEQAKNEIIATVKDLLPEIEKRFTTNEEKRDLRQFAIAMGLGTPEKLLRNLIENLASSVTLEQIPSVHRIESMIYGAFGKIKIKSNVQITPSMQAAGLKFLRVLGKVGLNSAQFSSEQLKDLDIKMKLVLSSIAQNEGDDPQELLEFFDKTQLTPETIMRYQKSDEQITEELLLQSFKYNVRYEINKPKHLLNLSYQEVMVLADAYNENKVEVRVAGELIKLKEVSSLKIFNIKDKKALDNEIYWSGTMAPEAKKFHNVATWTYDRFCQIGDDVTSKFLKPVIKWPTLAVPEPEMDIPALIKGGEGRKVEFKSRFRWDLSANRIEPKIEYKCLRAIAGFLNSDGGVLLIGIKDDGSILGIDDDFNSFAKGNKQDELKKHFDNLISNHFGKHSNASILFDYYEIEGKTIAYVRVEKANAEVFMKRNGTEEFYIRRSASTEQLHGSELLKYIREHWKGK
ncbi:MAG: ATP-binding protein [Bacteroidetes bacterium]|nr:ATP-binding protein [Bacteroidota bacterium]